MNEAVRAEIEGLRKLKVKALQARYLEVFGEESRSFNQAHLYRRVAWRLQALAKHDDGFRLAEVDLEIRGEGELLGTRQSGLAQFRVARLPDDQALLERARFHAQSILADDPELSAPEHALLAAAVEGAFGDDARAPIPA